ncbi:MAG TPA: cation:proton antiporter [Candidatus Bilamarchaeaceae archaeon]|nr:cation:proton antiporter [Candidatus Bilamarchaeaceae archaeon]
MADQLFSLGVVILLSLIGSVIALRMRVHPIVGLLLLGLAAGPSGLGIIEGSDFISTLAEVGAVLLIFGIGLEVNPHTMIGKGLRAIMVAIVKIAVVFIVIYECSLLLGFGLMESLLLGSMFCVTSTVVFAMVSKDSGVDKNLLMTVLIIEDIFCIFVLAMIPGLGGMEIGQMETIVGMAASLLILLGGYLLARAVLGYAVPFFIQSGDKGSVMYTSLALCFILSFGAEAVGLEAMLGAFLAGNVMAGLRGEEEVYQTMKPFTNLFSSFFFFSVGMSINAAWIIANPWTIIILAGVSILANYFGLASAMYFMGVESSMALRSAAMMLCIGEFSLVMANHASLTLGTDLVSVVSSVVFITAIAASITASKQDALAKAMERALSPKTRTGLRRVSRYMSGVMEAFEPGGSFYTLFVKELGRVGSNMVNVFIALAFSLILLKIGDTGIAVEYVLWIDVMAVLITVAAVAYEAPRLMKSALAISKGISRAFLRSEAPEELDRKMMSRSMAMVACLVAAVALAFVFSFMMLPKVFYYALGAFYLLAFVFFVDTVLTAGEMFKRKLKEKVHRGGRGGGGIKTALINFILE